MVCAVWIWFGLPNDPTNAYFLNEEEKWMMKVRTEQRKKYMGSDKFSWEEISIAARDPKLYFSGIIQFCQDILLYGFSTFLPAILKSMGYDSLKSNALTVPVYVWGAIAFISIAFFSDRYRTFAPVSYYFLPGYVFEQKGDRVLMLTVPSSCSRSTSSVLSATSSC